jgi:hypothetical protein
MTTRRSILAGLAYLALSPAAIAAPVDTPEAFVSSLYARVTAGDGRSGGADLTPRRKRAQWFTGSLVELWNRAEDKAEKDGDIGPVDFDLLSDSQDPEVRRVDVRGVEEGAGTAKVRVGLFASKKPKSGQKPSSVLEFTLKRENTAWRIDDVAKVMSADPWTLRGLLTAD